MSQNTLNLIAIDCGNSSIRTTLGRFDGERFSTELISRTEQREVLLNGLYYWDLPFIVQQIKEGIARTAAKCGRIDSAAISTWGIDFGMLNEEKVLISLPLSYRNTLGDSGLKAQSSEQLRRNFMCTGIQNDKINTLYQLIGLRGRFPKTYASVSKILLIPDLLNYFFTGQMSAEATQTSTSQLFDTKEKRYAAALMDEYGIERELFPELLPHGSERGLLLPKIADELGIEPFPFVTIPAHDTAAAVVAVTPESDEEFLFISSGTWSLIGTELNEPVIDERVYASPFTNEEGILGTTTLLKNSAGLYIARRIFEEARKENPAIGWDAVTALAAQADAPARLIDPNDVELFNPVNMRQAIMDKAGLDGADDARLFRVVYDSLAASYKQAFDEIETLTGRHYGSVYIVGGGAENRLLNRLTEQASGKCVRVGFKEATSMGNLGAQLLYRNRAAGLREVRDIIRKSAPDNQ